MREIYNKTAHENQTEVDFEKNLTVELIFGWIPLPKHFNSDPPSYRQFLYFQFLPIYRSILKLILHNVC